METTKLSSKGQVIIPKAFRAALHWEPGLELEVIDTGDGLLLKPKVPFAETKLADVAGMLRSKVQPMSDKEIEAALVADVRRRWRGRD
jgi:AbrB family looped-hinge helix DNA binding protein